MHKLLAALACVSLLSACTKEPPKCSDPATVSWVRKILLEQSGLSAAEREKMAAKLVEATMALENIRPSASDDKIKKLSCEADLVLSNGDAAVNKSTIPLRYDSQLGDRNAHIVKVTSLTVHDPRTLNYYLTTAIAHAQAKNGGAAIAPAASAPQEAAAADAAAEEAELREENAILEAEDTSDTVEQSGVCKGLDLAITAENRECLSRQFTIADKILNDEYKRAMSLLTPERGAELKTSQRAWIKEKKEACEEAGKEFEGGSLEAVVAAGCEVRMTEERSEFLKQYR